MGSSSPPVLYLSDDDDDNEVEQHMPYGHSLSDMMNDSLPRKKRKLTNTNVRINPSIVNWSKRQRNDHYYQSHQIPSNLTNHDREVIVLNPNDYNLEEQESHSFHAFDWSSEARTSNRIHQHPIQTLPRVSIIPRPLPLPPPSNVVNVVKHHLNYSDSVPLMPMSRQNDRYMQQSQRKLNNIPKSTTPPQPLPLPLPTQTSSIIRPTAQRVQPGKNLRNPYLHSTSSPLLPTRQSTEPIFPRTFHSPCSAPIITPTATPEIRRQALNGTGILSAFYDSKCYRCNICKFKSITSSTLLQHLFTHIFFCHHCSFYTYSHHNLYQHIFEKHDFNLSNDNIDPKMLELLYLTRCPDGTFALCMDSSPPKPPTPPPPPPKPDEQPIIPPPPVNNKKPTKPKTPRKKKPKQKKEEDNDIVLIAEKRDIDLQPSPSTSTTAKHPVIKEKQANTYVLMKHRRCYAVKHPPCLHSLSVEYSICREHTIRHMCHTQDIFKRHKFKPKSNIIRLIDEVANCLKTIVNDVVDMEEKSDPSDLLFALPNTILNLIFPTEDLNILTSSLKLCNKYDKAIEQVDQNISEEPVRTSNQHVFILSATGVNKHEQSIFASLNSSITSADTVFTQTKLKKLPQAYDNTHRFFKAPISTTQQATTSNAKSSNKNSISQPTNSEPIQSPVAKTSRYINHSSSPTVDRNNNSVTSSTPSVIVLD